MAIILYKERGRANKHEAITRQMMHDGRRIFHSASLRTAGTLAASLEKQLKEQTASKLSRTEENTDTMDLGTIVIAVISMVSPPWIGTRASPEGRA
jgi:hypothetical protein